MFVLDCRAGQMFWSWNLVRNKSCLSWNELSFLTASSHRENLPGHFKFKEYCPQVFRNLRERFGIEDLDYQVCKVESLAGDHWWYCWMAHSKQIWSFCLARVQTVCAAKRIDLNLLWATQRQQVLVVNLLAPPTIRNGGWLYWSHLRGGAFIGGTACLGQMHHKGWS